jgi:hypothetical protein
MADDINILQAVLAIDSTAQVTVYPDGTMKWNTTPIAEEDILAKQAELQAEYDALEYARARAVEYPITTEFIEAYTEKEILNDDTKWNEYVSKYNQVRTDNPKE